ncbi:sigma factor-like helix-turn-helix DNA-binding protein [Salicibibacter halophilus]|uniref:sigma factor-like helix-turn-helix DNA-binding protein n=1 Tax=Salicibibacter halophilus TaxID=2502791 RepID=UPI00135BDFC5|nr:sigma factor-like helix-turn-helix DNA-binding protein [Salicibibacter halophilus]
MKLDERHEFAKLTIEQQLDTLFINLIERMKDNTNPIFKERTLEALKYKHQLELNGQKATLEIIGQHMSVTRERVRQILNKATNKLVYTSDGLTKLIRQISDEKSYIKNEWLDFHDFYHFIILEMLETNNVYLVNNYFTNRSPQVREERWSQTKELAKETFWGELTSYSDLMKWLVDNTVWPRKRMEEFVDENFIEASKRKGQYLLNLNISTKVNLTDIVMKEFPEGAEIYQEEDKLSSIGNELIAGTFNKKRDFSAVALRSQNIYLWERGTYIHTSFVNVPHPLLEKIEGYLLGVFEERSSLNVTRVFKAFKSELTEMSVPTEYALYTLLREFGTKKIYYPKYPLITKEDEPFQYNADRLRAFIQEQGGEVNTTQLQEEFIKKQGWKEFTLWHNLANEESIIRSAHAQYRLIDDYETLTLEHYEPFLLYIEDMFQKMEFISVHAVFEDNKVYSQSINIYSDHLLYDLLKIHYGDKYEFIRYPHILSSQTEMSDVSNRGIVEDFVKENESIVSREEVINFITESVGAHPKILDFALSFSDHLLYFTRGQYGEYVHYDVIGWNNDKQEEIEQQVSQYLQTVDKPYASMEMIFSQSQKPKLEGGIVWSFDLFTDLLSKNESFLIAGAFYKIISLKSRGIKTELDLISYIIEEEFNGVVKKTELYRYLISIEYSSDGKLFQHVMDVLAKDEAPFYEVGDEFVSKNSKGWRST